MTKKDNNIDDELATMDDLKGREFKPVFTMKEVEEQESMYQLHEQDIGIGRRLAYTITSKSKSELTEIINKDPDVFMDMVERIGDAVKVYQNVIDVMSSAEIRSLVVASEAVERLDTK